MARRPKPATPWKLPPLPEDVMYAIQSVAKGTANPFQQRRAFEFLTEMLCETDRMSFWPGGEDGRRASDFAEGKRWVGLQLRRILKLRT
jgi:hypothetical protein